MLSSDASFYQTITRYILYKYNLKSEVRKNVSWDPLGASFTIFCNSFDRLVKFNIEVHTSKLSPAREADIRDIIDKYIREEQPELLL